MKKFLLFLLLLITGFSPTWADKLKLHVTDMQNHNVAHIKLNLNYPEGVEHFFMYFFLPVLLRYN